MKTLNATPSKTLADILEENGIAPIEGQTVACEISLTVKGTLSKGESYMAAQTCNALGLIDLARAFRACGVTKNAVKKNVLLSALGKLQLNAEKESEAQAIAKEIQAVFQRLPKAKREGKRTGKLTVTCDAGLI